MADATQEKASYGDVDRGFGEVGPPKNAVSQ